MRDDAAIEAIRVAQDDMITRQQVLAEGGTDEWIEAQIAGGRWLRIGRKVFKTTTGEPTRRQRERAALLCAGTEAALSHRSAADRFGLHDRDDGPVHITVPYGRSADPHPGVVIHRSRAFDRIVIDREDLPTVSAADTCIDLAVLEPDARQGMRTLLHAALSMRVPAERLRTVLEVRRPKRYATALRHAAEMLADGVGSVLEARYLVDVEQAHGIPTATRQAPVTVEGVERYEDCRYDMPGGELIVRLDGWRWHSDPRVAVIDRARDNAAELAGRARLTFGWDEVIRDPCRVAATVATRLRQLGWSGPCGAVSCRCSGAA
jgi:hypothetical protein